MVIATVSEQSLGTLARTPGLPGDGADTVEQRQELSDVVALAAGQGDRQRNPAGVGAQMVLGTGAGTVNRRAPGVEPPKALGYDV